ncbi:hypothetical protein MYE70_13130 [Marinobacter alexandrii]|uniref:DUF6586 family protein n=1 Tax=Marinobacter alexandrii TaxID=2570351 RepID=UPI001FFEB3D0|nr:DUF6586 family protein [Marinobacter alexandrii]MCK2150004.1 hypothetical protein [Marinobacter alexandrii]
MASQWHSLVSQKLVLARVLLSQAASGDQRSDSEAAHALGREAMKQGSIELLLRARGLLLVMIARLYQQRTEEPATLDELAALIGDEANEVSRLRELAGQANNWWNHLDQLAASQSRPPINRKSVSAENIIAVSADTGPDRSIDALRQTLDAMKIFADALEEQHSEW